MAHLRFTALAICSAAIAGFDLGTAVAQEASGSNIIWLGQIGIENQLVIVQAGGLNVAGSDAAFLRLGQDGANNEMRFEQIGYGNVLATWFSNEPGYARGVWQRGNSNVMHISQNSADEATGANSIGSISQESALAAGSPDYNSLEINQSAGADGAGQHVIGRVVQRAQGGINRASITQTGGGASQAGNILANLRQIGQGNQFIGRQDGMYNRIGLEVNSASLPLDGVVQEGNDHLISLTQQGMLNTVSGIWQKGAQNKLNVVISGDANLIERIYQDTQSWQSAAVGNTAQITVIGTGNGSNGWETIQTTEDTPSELLQYGDENDMTVSLLNAIDTRFAATQDGISNELLIEIGLNSAADAHRNESLIYQRGDFNTATQRFSGNDTVGAIRQIGDFNTSALIMTGNFNGSTHLGAQLHGPAGDAALKGDLLIGRIEQISLAVDGGQGQRATLQITGDYNAFAVRQEGHSNFVEAVIFGSQNAVAIGQIGREHHAITAQYGSGNSIGIWQN